MPAYNSSFPPHAPTATLHQLTTPSLLWGHSGRGRPLSCDFDSGYWHHITVSGGVQEAWGENSETATISSLRLHMLSSVLLSICSLNGLVGTVQVASLYVVGSPWGGCLLAFSPLWYPLCLSEGWSFQFLGTSTWQKWWAASPEIRLQKDDDFYLVPSPSHAPSIWDKSPAMF